jgi:hypothetical protein
MSYITDPGDPDADRCAVLALLVLLLPLTDKPPHRLARLQYTNHNVAQSFAAQLDFYFLLYSPSQGSMIFPLSPVR